MGTNSDKVWWRQEAFIVICALIGGNYALMSMDLKEIKGDTKLIPIHTEQIESLREDQKEDHADLQDVKKKLEELNVEVKSTLSILGDR